MEALMTSPSLSPQEERIGKVIVRKRIAIFLDVKRIDQTPGIGMKVLGRAATDIHHPKFIQTPGLMRYGFVRDLSNGCKKTIF
jgi:hypothetical protein